MKINCNARGFTLIECLITITILAILLAVAVPIGRDFLLKRAVVTEAEEVVSALRYARREAALMGKTLILTPLSNAETDDWSSGALLFVDNNHNHVYEASTDKVLYEWQWHDANIAVNWGGVSKKYLQFIPTGLENALSGTFYVCPLNTQSVKTVAVVMNRLGRVRVEENEKTCHT